MRGAMILSMAMAATAATAGAQGNGKTTAPPPDTIPFHTRIVVLGSTPGSPAITSNFEPTDPGWRFWQYFRKDHLLDRVADYVFDGENDLVVDTGSMTSLFDDPAGLKPKCILNYQKSPLVHHVNYFRQPQTIAAISETFKA